MRLQVDENWSVIGAGHQSFATLCHRLLPAFPAALGDRSLHFFSAPLSTHPDVQIVGLRAPADGADSPMVFAFLGKEFVHYISGATGDLAALNQRVTPHIAAVQNPTPAQAADYLGLALEVARGQEGWRVVERSEDIAWRTNPPPAAELAEAARIAHAVKAEPIDSDGRFACSAVVQTEGKLLQCSLILWRKGLWQMEKQADVLKEAALGRPLVLPPFRSLLGQPFTVQPDPKAAGPATTLSGTFDTGKQAKSPPSPPGAPSLRSRPRTFDEAARRIAGILLDTAIRQDAKRTRSANGDAVDGFFAHLREFRPTVALVTPYQELRSDFASLIADKCGLPLNLSWEDGPFARNVQNPMKLSTAPEVVLLTDATFVRSYDTGDTSISSLIAPIIRGPHIALMVVDNMDQLPQEVRDRIDRQLTVPRIDHALFWECTETLFPDAGRTRRRRADWIRYLLPRDIARAAAGTTDVRRYLKELNETINDRLAHYTAPDAPSLHELAGLGEARFRMEELSADIQAALKGTITWKQVDRGYLLVGPPGTGKTTLVRALAKDCGIRFMLASASQWQESGTLEKHVQAIRATFREARLFAPSILFIDEIDSVGARSSFVGQNASYQTLVVNTVLEQMQGFEDREGVVVIGATNNLADVDEALRRPGRLDRIIEVPYPNVAALAQIFLFYLDRARREGLEVGAIDAERMGKLTFGRTGSHVELYVRGAMRRVRRSGRKTLTEEDLIAEITNRSPEGLQRVLSPQTMRRVAVHEAGHAIIATTGVAKDQEIAMISIIPRADGSLGFVARVPADLDFVTLDRMEEQVRIFLGGRAAEEIVFGSDQIGSGSGGAPGSDLAQATRLVVWMLTEFGFSEAGGLLWFDWRSENIRSDRVTAEAIRNLPMGEEILKEARRTLDQLYTETKKRLMDFRTALDRTAELLIEKQEVMPETLRKIIG